MVSMDCYNLLQSKILIWSDHEIKSHVYYVKSMRNNILRREKRNSYFHVNNSKGLAVMHPTSCYVYTHPEAIHTGSTRVGMECQPRIQLNNIFIGGTTSLLVYKSREGLVSYTERDKIWHCGDTNLRCLDLNSAWMHEVEMMKEQSCKPFYTTKYKLNKSWYTQ